MSDVTMHEVFQKYLADVVPNLSERTQMDYQRHITILEKHFGHMDPDAIRPRDIGMFLDVPKGKIHRNRSISSANRGAIGGPKKADLQGRAAPASEA